MNATDEDIPTEIASQFDRLPPHSIEAEQCLIGSMMLTGGEPEAFDRMTIGLIERAFFQADHQILFRVMKQMRGKGKTFDPVILRGELESRQLLSEIGGTAYLSQIINTVPSSAHGEHYAKIVIEKFQLREAITAANDIIRHCYAPAEGGSASEVLMRSANHLIATAATGRSDAIITIGQACQELIEKLRGDGSLFVETGIADLDDLLIGLPLGGYTLIGADSRVGKSLVARDIAKRIAKRAVPVGVISLEENRLKIAANTVASEAVGKLEEQMQGVFESKRVMAGKMTDAEWQAVMTTAGELESLPMVIDEASTSISDIETSIARMASKYHCQVIIIDHFHLIDLGDTNNEVSAQSTISGRLKTAFKMHKVCGIVLTQVNKSGDLSERPSERSIRGTNRQFNDADVVIALFREDFGRFQKHLNSGGDSKSFEPNNLIELIVLKGKNSGGGVVVKQIDVKHQRLLDRPEESDANLVQLL